MLPMTITLICMLLIGSFLLIWKRNSRYTEWQDGTPPAPGLYRTRFSNGKIQTYETVRWSGTEWVYDHAPRLCYFQDRQWMEIAQ